MNSELRENWKGFVFFKMSLKIPLGGCAHSLHQCWTHPTVNWPSSNWTDFVSKLRSNRVSFNMLSLICTNMHEFIKYQGLIVEHVQTFHCKNIDMLALLSHHHHHHHHHHHNHHDIETYLALSSLRLVQPSLSATGNIVLKFALITKLRKYIVRNTF